MFFYSYNSKLKKTNILFEEVSKIFFINNIRINNPIYSFILHIIYFYFIRNNYIYSSSI